MHDCRCFVMADLLNEDLQIAHVTFDTIRGRLDIGILLFAIDLWMASNPLF